jgi:hypothetical protein
VVEVERGQAGEPQPAPGALAGTQPRSPRYDDGHEARPVTGDGPWWVVIDLGLPYTGGEVLEPGRVRFPFATGESARQAADALKVSVHRDPEVITGEVIGETPAISPA